jgi:hypothetical protein
MQQQLHLGDEGGLGVNVLNYGVHVTSVCLSVVNFRTTASNACNYHGDFVRKTETESPAG